MLRVIDSRAECGGNHYRVRDIGSIEYIILHRFGSPDLEFFNKEQITPDARGVAEFYARHPSYTGGQMPYTFVIGYDGKIEQAADIGDTTPHARRFNSAGLGVALLGDFRFLPPTEQQKTALLRLLPPLVQYLGAQIVGHDELKGASSNDAKVCPGANLDLKTIKEQVADVISNNAGMELHRAGVKF